MRYFNTVFQSTIRFIMDMWVAERNNEVNTLPELTRCPFCGEIHKWETDTDDMHWGKAWNSRPVETELKTAAILLGDVYNGK